LQGEWTTAVVVDRVRYRRQTDRCKPQVPRVAHLKKREVHRHRNAGYAYLDGLAPQLRGLRAAAVPLIHAGQLVTRVRAQREQGNFRGSTQAQGGPGGAGAAADVEQALAEPVEAGGKRRDQARQVEGAPQERHRELTAMGVARERQLDAALSHLRKQVGVV